MEMGWDLRHIDELPHTSGGLWQGQDNKVNRHETRRLTIAPPAVRHRGLFVSELYRLVRGSPVMVPHYPTARAQSPKRRIAPVISSPLRLDIEVSGLMSRVAVHVRLLLSRRL